LINTKRRGVSVVSYGIYFGYELTKALFGADKGFALPRAVV